MAPIVLLCVQSLMTVLTLLEEYAESNVFCWWTSHVKNDNTTKVNFPLTVLNKRHVDICVILKDLCVVNTSLVLMLCNATPLSNTRQGASIVCLVFIITNVSL